MKRFILSLSILLCSIYLFAEKIVVVDNSSNSDNSFVTTFINNLTTYSDIIVVDHDKELDGKKTLSEFKQPEEKITITIDYVKDLYSIAVVSSNLKTAKVTASSALTVNETNYKNGNAAKYTSADLVHQYGISPNFDYISLGKEIEIKVEKKLSFQDALNQKQEEEKAEEKLVDEYLNHEKAIYDTTKELLKKYEGITPFDAFLCIKEKEMSEENYKNHTMSFSINTLIKPNDSYKLLLDEFNEINKTLDIFSFPWDFVDSESVNIYPQPSKGFSSDRYGYRWYEGSAGILIPFNFYSKLNGKPIFKQFYIAIRCIYIDDYNSWKKYQKHHENEKAMRIFIFGNQLIEVGILPYKKGLFDNTVTFKEKDLKNGFEIKFDQPVYFRDTIEYFPPENITWTQYHLAHPSKIDANINVSLLSDSEYEKLTKSLLNDYPTQPINQIKIPIENDVLLIDLGNQKRK